MHKYLISFILSFLACLGFIKGEELEKKYCYELSVCAIFKDEAAYLKEWIEFHKLIGVEHFYLVNHCSCDDYLAVLQPYIDKGEVELFHCFDARFDAYGFMHCVQPQEYAKIIQYCKHETKWLAVIDADEFLFPTCCDRLTDFLKDYEAFGGVYVFWQMFGTSFVPKIMNHRLLIETFVFQSDKNYYYNKWGKSIVRPDRVEKVHLHFCKYISPYVHVFPNKEEIPEFELIMKLDHELISTFDVDVSKIRINHYWTRDEFYSQSTKRSRYRDWGLEAEYFSRVNQLNKKPNYDIFKYVDQLKEKMFGVD
ncbi:MAG: glycosyltransferase family 92 protein [Parachlamydiaceae bacterium]